jgi:iron-sulfur cluster repair protein YtfE (RIC family)
VLVSLGKRRESAELADLLLECHGRIRQFLALAADVAARRELATKDVSEACSRVQRYFTEALPLHVEDEEVSVLPRLLGRNVELDRTLSDMRREHTEHEPVLAELLASAARLHVAPDDLRARLALGAAAAALAREFEPHLAREEAVIFPAVNQLLTASEREAIRAELRARRGG